MNKLISFVLFMIVFNYSTMSNAASFSGDGDEGFLGDSDEEEFFSCSEDEEGDEDLSPQAQGAVQQMIQTASQLIKDETISKNKKVQALKALLSSLRKKIKDDAEWKAFTTYLNHIQPCNLLSIEEDIRQQVAKLIGMVTKSIGNGLLNPRIKHSRKKDNDDKDGPSSFHACMHHSSSSSSSSSTY